MNEQQDMQSAWEIQIKESKKQSFWARVCGICAIVFLCVVLMSVFWVKAKVETLYDAVLKTTENLSDVSEDLAEIDFATMTEDVSRLVNDAETSLTETMEKVNSLDIDSLNKSIEELHQILEPISNFFGGFRR